MSEVVRFRCLDEPNCGRTFYAYPDEGRYCPYCREMAEIVRPDHPAVSADARALETAPDEAFEPTYLYRCTECGKLSVSLGWLHAHCEKHRGWGIGPFRFIPPWRLPRFDALMELTEVLRVESVEPVALEEVPKRLIADGGEEKGHAPDARDIDDISAVGECHSCGWAPAAIVLVDSDWECYNCGKDPDAETDPFACYICGHPLHEVDLIEGEELCESCRREYGDEKFVADGGVEESGSDLFNLPNEGDVILDPDFVCDACGYATVRLIVVNGKPAAKCTNCGQGYLSTQEAEEACR